MKQLAKPLYTIESFINNLVGGTDVLEVWEEQEGGPLYLKWDGNTIHISTDKTFKVDPDNDTVQCGRLSPGIFWIDLDTPNCWYMTFNFSDGGLVKNRIYRASDYTT